MLETIAMWGGVAGLAVGIVAIIAIILVRANIKEILNKDLILFDKNFELKKEAITKALSLIDEIETKGPQVMYAPEFGIRAKTCYNDLLCVVTDVKVADEFLKITTDRNQIATPDRLAHFKLMCRHDIGLKTKYSKKVKKESVETYQPQSSFQPNMTAQQPQYVQPAQPVQPQYVQPQARPVSQPAPAQPRPVVQPQMVQQPVAQPVAKRGRPRKD